MTFKPAIRKPTALQLKVMKRLGLPTEGVSFGEAHAQINQTLREQLWDIFDNKGYDFDDFAMQDDRWWK